jgi:predicted nucleic acid-binding protein
MRLLADTNIVLRYIHRDSVQHAEVEAAVDRLIGQASELVLVPQVLYEVWAVVTRPYGTGNGFSYTTEQAVHAVQVLTATFACLPDLPELFGVWLDLVTTHQVSGRPTHDARLAAAVTVHGLDALLTLNADDFKRFGIQVLTPADI